MNLRFPLLLAALALAGSLRLQAQLPALPPELRFEKTTHNFGTLREEDHEASYSFAFRNAGKQAITLLDVKPSCGCTTPDWSKQAIAPGQSGFVKAIYSTTGRPGPFDKTITVRARLAGAPADGSQDVITVLSIQGNVTPRRLGVNDFYPYQSGNLRMNTNNVSFNRVYAGKKTGNRLKFYNQGNEPITINRVQAPAYLSLVLPQPATIQPKDSLSVHIDFDGATVNDWGFVSERFVLETNDPVEPAKYVYATALVEEDFSQLTPAERANAPVIHFDSTAHNFGTVAQGAVVLYEFVFTNKGKRDLVIHKTKATCGCTATEPSKKVLKPGETSSIQVRFNTRGFEERQVKYVTVITNDPKNSMVNLALEGTVLKPGTQPQAGSGN